MKKHRFNQRIFTLSFLWANVINSFKGDKSDFIWEQVVCHSTQQTGTNGENIPPNGELPRDLLKRKTDVEKVNLSKTKSPRSKQNCKFSRWNPVTSTRAVLTQLNFKCIRKCNCNRFNRALERLWRRVAYQRVYKTRANRDDISWRSATQIEGKYRNANAQRREHLVRPDHASVRADKS